MENPLRPYQPANKFFYKFYNYNLEDSSILDMVPNELYAHVTRELMFFNSNAHMSNMDIMKFSVLLFNMVKSNFTAQHESLTNSIKEL
jgi:hypothetical protein